MFKSVKSLHIHKLQLGIILSKETLLHYAVFTMILYVLLSHGLILRDRLCCDFARDLIKLDFFQAVIGFIIFLISDRYIFLESNSERLQFKYVKIVKDVV